MKKVLNQASVKENEAVIVELIKRLNQNQLAGKIAITAIIPVCFSNVSSGYQQTLVT
jgi:hypothetical protein